MSFFSAVSKLFRRRPPARDQFLGHWYKTAQRQAIPGGLTIKPRVLVIHFTAGASALSSIAYWRQINRGKPESKRILAHFIIGRNGQIYQCRPGNVRAGHAGTSVWTLKSGETLHGLNAHSIGIELANGGHSYPTQFSHLIPTQAKHKHGGPVRLWETFTPEQLAACKRLSRDLVEYYGLEDVVGHDDIAPGRKTDPGPAFPMQDLRRHCGIRD